MFAARIAKPKTKANAVAQRNQPTVRAGPATDQVASGSSFDLAEIPIFPPRRRDQPRSRFTIGELSKSTIIQPKLAVGSVNDPHEHEADRVADQVLATPAQTSIAGASPQIQPFSSSSRWDALGPSASAKVGTALSGAGTTLPADLRQDMGRRFGFDFSRVRIHADGEAGRSAEGLNAQAYTAGYRVVFAPGQFAPKTAHGLRLLSHELTHVIQQAGGSSAAGVREQAPQAVQRQKAPDIDLARKLGTKLKAGKRDDVLTDIEALPVGDLNGLELVVTQAFALDEPTADELRRIIRFVRDKPFFGTGTLFTAAKGTAQSKAAAKIGKGTVEVKTGVSVESGAGSSKEAYTLSYTGDDADQMHWMQFIWREVKPEYPAKAGKPSKAIEKTLTHSGRSYDLTTDESKKNWQTDSGSSNTPFYEEGTTVKRTGKKEVTMADFPSTEVDDIKPLFDDPTKAPTRVVSKFHADTYLIRNADVVYRAQVDLEWDLTSAEPPAVKAKVTGGPADHIEAEQRASLISTDPTVDFLAGPKPDPLGEFMPIKNPSPPGTLSEKDWADAKTTDSQRFADIVKVAHAEWINQAAGVASNNINSVREKKDAQPGLNYVASFTGADGETGFVDAAGHYVGRAMPTDKTGPLPRIAILLGPDTLHRGKAQALETLRHEQRHFTHAQLAVGWLLKWRDAGAKTAFKDWLDAQHKAKKISDLDFDLVKASVDLTDIARVGTEVFAHLEGILTGLPFLPPKPAIDAIKREGSRSVLDYRAPIDQLHLMRKYFDVADSAVKTRALERLHEFCCQDLDSEHRDGFVAWLKFLLNLISTKATSADEKLVQADFKGYASFLKQLLASVQKRC